MAVPSFKAEHYVLHSELAQLCLPAAHRDRNQKLAWVNSLCLIYLIIGLAGIKPPLPTIRDVVPIDEPVAVPIEAPPTQVTTEETTEEPPDTNPELSDAPAVVAVTLDSPATDFSVPTVGNLLVAQSAAQAPPPRPLPQAQAAAPKVRNLRLGQSAGGFFTPPPTYPQDALRAGRTNSMILLISVDTAGRVAEVKVEETKGYAPLVDYAIAHVKRRFMFPPSEEPLVYRCPFDFNIQ